MRDSTGEVRTSGHGAKRGAARPLLGSLFFAAVLAGLPACEKCDGGVSEAVEEIQDEVDDAT